MSADRRFKFTFLAVVLLVLFGFGAWYGFVREDGGAGEVAQDVIDGSMLQDRLAGEAPGPDAGAREHATREAAPVGADTPVDPLAAVDPEVVEQLPEGAAAVAGNGAEAEAEVAAVDPSVTARGAAESAGAPAPVFDIVRVEPSGDAVIAGRSYPGAVVELLRNGVVHDRIVADASGAFAFIPPPFPAGTSEVVLRVAGEDGAAQQSEQSVTVVIADDLKTTPMVAMAAPNQPTVVLSRPENPTVEVAAAEAAAEVISADETPPDDRQQVAAADATTLQSGRPAIRIASVEAETGGGLFVTGEVAPNATVRLYLNDTFVAPAEAGADGTVSFSIERGVRPGSYRVRLDEVTGETGTVLSRAEIVFVVPEMVAEASIEAPDATISPEPAEQVVVEAETLDESAPERAASTTIPEISTAVVTRGDSLWRISRQVYGSGMRYTEIFEANQNQIRNPDLIYPGQLFVLPADPARAQSPDAPEQRVN